MVGRGGGRGKDYGRRGGQKGKSASGGYGCFLMFICITRVIMNEQTV